LTAAAALRFATRGSPQARTQAQQVADAIAAATGHRTELVIVETTGDRQQAVPLHTIGGQGVFVKEVQQAIVDGRADVAVHSAKDLPSESPATLRVGAFCARRDPADAVVGRPLAALAAGATVATGSVRRRAQLAAVRPHVRFVELRGNIARRLEQVPADGALLMAVAALDILGLTDRIAERLDPATFVPAVGQGCVAVECRADDGVAMELLAAVDDPQARFAVTTERAFLAELGAGCTLPLGAHCDDGTLHGFLATEDLGDDGRPRRVFHEAVVVPGDPVAAAAAATALARRARAVVGG
jgi:hydroxymethylbilane synthase